MRTITLEEHFASPGFLDGPGRELKDRALRFSGAAEKLLDRLCDVGQKRVAEMDAAGIDMQVLSLTSPGTEQIEGLAAVTLAREANDFLAGSVNKYPARFADLPPCPPDVQTRPLKSWNGWLVSTVQRSGDQWSSPGTLSRR
jgi:uncharacterized protein